MWTCIKGQLFSTDHAAYIGTAHGYVMHDVYESKEPDFVQSLYWHPLRRRFFLHQIWPDGYPGPRETIQVLPVSDAFEFVRDFLSEQ